MVVHHTQWLTSTQHPVVKVEVCSRGGSGRDTLGVKGRGGRGGIPIPSPGGGDIRTPSPAVSPSPSDYGVVRSPAGSGAEPRPKKFGAFYLS